MADATPLPAAAPDTAGVRASARGPLVRPWPLIGFGLLALVGLELSVRALDASRGYSWNARTAWYWLFEQDPALGYRGRPAAVAWIPGERVEHGPDGFREPRALGALPPREKRRLVLCVGDANTYGLTAGSADRSYPAVLERELRALSGDTRWTVVNAGVPGYTSHEVLELLKLRLLRLEPEVVLAMSLATDFEHVALYLDDALDYNAYPLRMAPWASTRASDLLMRSALVGRAAQRWRARHPDDLGGRYPMTAYGEATPRGRRWFLDNVDLAATLAARAGARLMWVDQPIHYSTCSYGETKIASVDALRVELRDLCRVRGVPVLEAHAGFDWEGLTLAGDLLLGSNETLLGAVGYERLARRVAPQILKALPPG
jgi:lysophospholipase L1-like esterase